MARFTTSHQQLDRQQIALYRFVYSARPIKLAVFLLLLFFCLNPVLPVLAAEETENTEAEDTSPTDETAVDTVKETEAPTSEPEEISEPKPVDQDQSETHQESSSESLGGELDESRVTHIKPDESAADNSGTDLLVPIPDDQSSTDNSAPVPAAATSSVSAQSDSQPSVSSQGTSTPAASTESSDADVATGSTTTGVAIEAGNATTNSEAATSSTQVSVMTLDSPVVATSTHQAPIEPSDESDGGNERVPDREIVESDLDSEEMKSVKADSATTTDAIPAPEYKDFSTTLSHSDSVYQFSKQDCVTMGEGRYHCFDEVSDVNTDNGAPVIARQDKDGDYEIYLNVAGEYEQLTDNRLDDTAPFYDPLSDSVVWQRLDDGRYSIYEYTDNGEVQISQNLTNNMEPSRAGEYTVWQTWLNDNWEIAFFNGVAMKVISNSNQPDIAPRIQDEYVIWNTVTNGTQKVAVYKILTGEISYIEAETGGRVENPRFVLVYDTKFDNGDVVTKGFNAQTGEVLPLGAQAPATPLDIPPSDSTGETRALIQNKSQSRDDIEELLIPKDVSTSTPETNQTSATTTVITSQVTAEVLELTDYDLIVPPNPVSTSSAQQSDSPELSEQVE